MKTPHVTSNELTVLQAIAQNEMNYANYSRPQSASETVTWFWTLEEEAYALREGMVMPKGKALSGTISSLTQKGLVVTDMQPDYYQGRDKMNDSTIALTELGFQTWKEKMSW